MNIDESIFKAYDIRGIYPKQLNEKTAQLVARGYLKILSEKLNKKVEDLSIVVGKDIRQSSEPLLAEVIKVFLNSGASVTDIGLISINDIYFATGNYNFDGGLIATASHNPPEYGGFKMPIKSPDYKKTVEFISGKDILKVIKDLPEADEPKKNGKLEKKDIIEDHLNHILSFTDIEKIKPFKIVVDTGNGMNGILMPKLFAKLPCELVHLFSDLDGNFPSRNPNPLIKGAADKVSQKVIDKKADFGFIYDVDGDRMFMVDEKGNFIRGDIVLLLIARAMLVKHPSSAIAYNLICSHAVPEFIEKWGGKPIRSEVGYYNLTKHMREEDGIMSGEVSGHFAFRDNYYTDSGFIALVLAIQALSVDGRKFSEVIKEYQLYSRGDEINLKVDDIKSKLDKIKTHYRDNIKDEIDGITVEFTDWWFNIRPSNTEPLLRITVEAANKEELKKRQEEVLSIIKN